MKYTATITVEIDVTDFEHNTDVTLPSAQTILDYWLEWNGGEILTGTELAESGLDFRITMEAVATQPSSLPEVPKLAWEPGRENQWFAVSGDSTYQVSHGVKSIFGSWEASRKEGERWPHIAVARTPEEAFEAAEDFYRKSETVRLLAEGTAERDALREADNETRGLFGGTS